MAVGFKEWEVVCAALGRGEQSILLRKGGIAEGSDGFQFKHREFYLFPTLFHEQAGKVRADRIGNFQAPGAGAENERSEIAVSLFARIDFHRVLENWERVEALENFHIWSEAEIRKRFEWDKAPGISLAFVRVYRLKMPWRLENVKGYGGCRSWLDLPDPPPDPPPGSDLEPVLGEKAHGEIRENLLAIVG